MNVSQKPADGKSIWWRFREKENVAHSFHEHLKLAKVDHIGAGTVIRLTAMSQATRQLATQSAVYSYYDIEWEYDIV